MKDQGDEMEEGCLGDGTNRHAIMVDHILPCSTEDCGRPTAVAIVEEQPDRTYTLTMICDKCTLALNNSILIGLHTRFRQMMRHQEAAEQMAQQGMMGFILGMAIGMSQDGQAEEDPRIKGKGKRRHPFQPPEGYDPANN